MTNEQLSELIGRYVQFYWSIPVDSLADRIISNHPDVTQEQIADIFKNLSDSFNPYYFYLVQEDVDSPEAVAEHLIAVDYDHFTQFLSARIEGPYCDINEDDLLITEVENPKSLELPEAQAIIKFGKDKLGLDQEWAEQLLGDCFLQQPNALCDGKSWISSVLRSEAYGMIRFTSVDQVNEFRDLGNALYQVLPNPVLKGWRPCDLEHPPKLPDDIPETDSDIPDAHEAINKVFDAFGGRENAKKLILNSITSKIGRNDPCPCGSGKKFKKCTCEEFHGQ